MGEHSVQGGLGYRNSIVTLVVLNETRIAKPLVVEVGKLSTTISTLPLIEKIKQTSTFSKLKVTDVTEILRLNTAEPQMMSTTQFPVNIVIKATLGNSLHTPKNYLILSLAMSDLLLAIIVISVYTLVTASILNLSFISVDRYYAVCQPLLYRSKISVNVVLIMILLCWSISVILGFGMIFLKLNILGVEEFYYNHVVCEGGCVMFQSKMSSTVSTVISFYLPGIIMLCVYLKIFLVAQTQFRSIQNAGCVNSVKKSNTSQTKATKTLAIVMGAFLCFWTPFFTCIIIDPFISYSTPPTFIVTLAWLGFLNSAVNPMIYAFFYSWFRKAFQLLSSGNIFIYGISDTTLFTE
uniref:Trace amine associated receptor 1 n=1 Tax=Labrus bergylta TaxID=56723 RepID=A0A3Q3E0Z1_9LABR